MKSIRFASLLLVAATFSVGSLAQTGAPVAAKSVVAGKDVMASKSLSADDREFMIKAAGNGLYEIEASKMAAKKSQSAAVRRYASMLVRDHTAASEELKTIAVAKPLRIPSDMPDGKKAQFDMLSKATPAEFDEKYVKLVAVEEHKADIELFETQVEKGTDPQVKAYAARTLPKLKMHLAGGEKLAAAGSTASTAK